MPASDLLPERVSLLTWGIPPGFGGVTNVLLHRARMFAELTGRQIDVLTLEAGRDQAALRSQLTRDGHLDQGVRLRNLWEDLAQATDRELGRRRWLPAPPLPPGFGPLPEDAATSDDLVDGTVRRRSAEKAGGGIAQVDHHRPDGSLLLSDRRDPAVPGVKRLLTLCDHRGRPLHSWFSAGSFYFWWLDRVLGAGERYLISDSKFVGGFLHRYRRPDLVVAQVVHTAHLSSGSDSTLGMLTPRKFDMMTAAGDYDAFVLLTQRQCEDLEPTLGPADNRYVVPNSRSVPPPGPAPVRHPRRGVLVGRLSSQKRVEDAIRVVARVRESDPGGMELRVLGEGEERPRLEALVARLGLQQHVHLVGHTNEVRAELEQASFLMMTSRAEGLPLALVEALAAGCIPLSYDVRYGPREVITPECGVLVPPGSVSGMADAVRRVLHAPAPELEGMREAARRRALDFSDEAVTRRWGEVLRTARARQRPPVRVRVRLSEVGVGAREDVLELAATATCDPVPVEPSAFLVLRGRSEPAYLRRRVELTELRAGSYRARAEVDGSELGWVSGGVLDVFLELRHRGGSTLTRFTAPDLDATLGLPSGVDAYATAHRNVSLRGFPLPRA